MTAPQNAPPPSPYSPWPPPAPAQAPKRWRTSTVASIATLGLLIGAGTGTSIYAALGNNNGSALPVAQPSTTTPEPVLQDPEALQQQTCAVMRAGYGAVANAVDERNKFDKVPWTDPGLLNATNNLVDVSSDLADELEASFTAHTPAPFKRAFADYVTGLRAIAISERNHSKDIELNGVGALYNQVLDTPLRMCGIPG